MRLAFILSLPRSGSTVLSKLLDARQGVICMPESAFPQLLGRLSREARQDPAQMAALYLSSSFSGTPLSFDEARACMNGDDGEILRRLGLAMASHTGRDEAQVSTVIWKSTRLVSFLDGPLSTVGKFAILRRHPDNVFDSQFRVPFGTNVRTPFRFSLFHGGYEESFKRIPADRRIELDYETIPGNIDRLLKFLGHEEKGFWPEGTSSLSGAVESRPWHQQIAKGFLSTDSEKRAKIDPAHLNSLGRARRLAVALRPVAYLLRLYLDHRSLDNTRNLARTILTEQSSAKL